MLTIKQVATELDGNQCHEEGSRDLFKRAADAGVVIIFGASDDLMECYGAVDDEIGAYNGATAYFTKGGLLRNACKDEQCPYFLKEQAKARPVHAIWDRDGFSWVYETDIPHETFIIYEDEETYCRGIVFRLDDV